MLDRIDIPTIIIHGDHDTKVPLKDPIEYIKNLKKAELIIISGSEHGFHEEPYQTQVVNITTDFFKKHL